MEKHTNHSISNWKKLDRIELTSEMSTLTLQVITES
jgi:hypothetical protein